MANQKKSRVGLLQILAWLGVFFAIAIPFLRGSRFYMKHETLLFRLDLISALVAAVVVVYFLASTERLLQRLGPLSQSVDGLRGKSIMINPVVYSDKQGFLKAVKRVYDDALRREGGAGRVLRFARPSGYWGPLTNETRAVQQALTDVISAFNKFLGDDTGWSVRAILGVRNSDGIKSCRQRLIEKMILASDPPPSNLVIKVMLALPYAIAPIVTEKEAVLAFYKPHEGVANNGIVFQDPETRVALVTWFDYLWNIDANRIVSVYDNNIRSTMLEERSRGLSLDEAVKKVLDDRFKEVRLRSRRIIEDLSANWK